MEVGVVLYATQKNIHGIRKQGLMSEDKYIDTMCLCHMCHKEMVIGQISPFLEWHICDECMDKEDE